jgi:predicted enzyme related to lactoylglutathione lyase
VPVRVLVNIDVDDLDRAMRFYVEGIGLTVGRRLGDGIVELMGEDGVAVYLLAKPAGTVAVPREEAAEGEAAGQAAKLARAYGRHWTPVHLDFVVEELEAAVARAVAAGAKLERAIEHHAWGSIAGLSDPFGHGLCLLRFTERGYDAIATAGPSASVRA